MSEISKYDPPPLKRRSIKELMRTRSLPFFQRGRISRSIFNVERAITVIYHNRKQIPARYWNKDRLLLCSEENHLDGTNNLITIFELVGKDDCVCRMTAFTGAIMKNKSKRDDNLVNEEHKDGEYEDVYECPIDEFADLLTKVKFDWEGERRLKEMYVLVKEDLKLHDLVFCQNMEIKRELIRRLGFDGIKQFAHIIDEKDDYILLDLVYGDIDFGRYLRMIDSTSRQQYLLRIPKTRDFGTIKIPIDNVKEALAWSFKMQKDKYAPKVET